MLVCLCELRLSKYDLTLCTCVTRWTDCMFHLVLASFPLLSIVIAIIRLDFLLLKLA